MAFSMTGSGSSHPTSPQQHQQLRTWTAHWRQASARRLSTPSRRRTTSPPRTPHQLQTWQRRDSATKWTQNLGLLCKIRNLQISFYQKCQKSSVIKKPHKNDHHKRMIFSPEPTKAFLEVYNVMQCCSAAVCHFWRNTFPVPSFNCTTYCLAIIIVTNIYLRKARQKYNFKYKYDNDSTWIQSACS